MQAIQGTITDDRLRVTIADRSSRQVVVTTILEVAPGNADSPQQRADAAAAYVRSVLPCAAYSVAQVKATSLAS